jgi:flavin prenyltransferase
MNCVSRCRRILGAAARALVLIGQRKDFKACCSSFFGEFDNHTTVQSPARHLRRDVRLVVAITGATGSILGIRLLEVLNTFGVETHLILSDWARATIKLETSYSVDQVRALASHVHSARDLAASISSGSFLTDGMVICPCSMKTLSAIRIGFSDNLITRAADVTLKERRRLVLVAREAPLNEIHLENMHFLARAGVVILPPTVAYYSRPTSVEDVTNYIVGRVADQLGIQHSLIPRWKTQPELNRTAQTPISSIDADDPA